MIEDKKIIEGMCGKIEYKRNRYYKQVGQKDIKWNLSIEAHCLLVDIYQWWAAQVRRGDLCHRLSIWKNKIK